MHSYYTPEATDAGTISATITGDGWHAILFLYQNKSRNGEEVWKDFLQGFVIEI